MRARGAGLMSGPADRGALPRWRRVLVVVAHPDDESFALGALLERLIVGGARVSVLCLTHGEASTLGGATDELAAVRAAELQAASDALGVARASALTHPDGALAEVDPGSLTADVESEIERERPDGILVFDPRAGVTGHEDHAAASLAAITVARRRGLPVLGWALPEDVSHALNAEYGAAFAGYPSSQLSVITVTRERQRLAIACHTSQAVPGSVLWRRLELLGDREYVRVV